MRTAAVAARRALVALTGALALLTPAAAAAAVPPSWPPVVTGTSAGPATATAVGHQPAGAAVSVLGQRAQGYRYWSFWIQRVEGGEWEYASQGPGTLRPADGAVLGFRFAVSVNSREGERPRGEHTFDGICADVPAKSGERRVALVLDFGTARDAPRGERPPQARTACAVLPDGATAADALAAEAAPLRYHGSGLLCAIDGYPARGCGEPATVGPEDAQDTQDTQDGAENGDADDGADDGVGGTGPQGVGVWLGLAAVALLAAAALGRARRRER